MGGVYCATDWCIYATFCQEKGILLQKYRDRNGRCIAILFQSIGVRGRSAQLLAMIRCEPCDVSDSKCNWHCAKNPIDLAEQKLEKCKGGEIESNFL